MNIIARLLAVYGEPRTENPAAFLDEFAKAIAGTSDAALQRAVDAGMKQWQFFPRPAELLEIIRKQNPTSQRQAPNWEAQARIPRTPEQIAANRTLMANLFVRFDRARSPIRGEDAATLRDRFLSAQARPGDAIRRAMSGKDRAAGERE